MTRATGAANAQAYSNALVPTSTRVRKIENPTPPPLKPNPKMDVGKRHSKSRVESGRKGSVSKKMVATAEPLNAPISAVKTIGRVCQMRISMPSAPKFMPACVVSGAVPSGWWLLGSDTTSTSIRIEHLFRLGAHAMKGAVCSNVSSKVHTTRQNPTDCVRRNWAPVAQSLRRLQTKPHE
jgi:hypothetical protein